MFRGINGQEGYFLLTASYCKHGTIVVFHMVIVIWNILKLKFPAIPVPVQSQENLRIQNKKRVVNKRFKQGVCLAHCLQTVSVQGLIKQGIHLVLKGILLSSQGYSRLINNTHL